MSFNEHPKSHDISLGVSSVLLAVIAKFILDSVVNVLIDDIFIISNIYIKTFLIFISFVIISSFLIKKICMPITFCIFKVISFLEIRTDLKIEKDEYLTPKQFNLLVPCVVLSVIVFDLLNVTQSFNIEFPYAHIYFILLIISFFMISLRITEETTVY